MRYLACDKCKGPVRVDDGSFLNSKGEQCDHLGQRSRNAESTMTIFRGPDGKISIPWEPDAPCPKGYVVEEVRGTRAVRKLERELDQKDIARHKSHQEKLRLLHEPARAKRREDLKQIIREGVTTHEGRTIRVSEFGRAIAREALRRSESGYTKQYDPGNYRRE